MKYLIIFLSFSASAANFDDFAKAISLVESGHKQAYNRRENAIGIYQIRKAAFLDAQKHDPALKKFRHQDCFNSQVGKRVLWSYCEKWEPQSLRGQNWGNLARLYNSGPNWRKKMSLTNDYSSRVKNLLTLAR